MEAIIYTGKRDENGRVRKTLALYIGNRLKFADLDVGDGWHMAGVECGYKLKAMQGRNNNNEIEFYIRDGKFLPYVCPKLPECPLFDVYPEVLKDSDRIGEEPVSELRKGIESVLG